MKKKNFFGLMAVILIFSACNMADLGNYDYKSPDEVLPVEIADLTISGTLQTFAEWSCEPEFIRLDDEQRYTYRWYVITTSGVNKLTELAQTKNLYLAHNPLAEGSYRLYYEVKDAANDIFVRKDVLISVSSTVLDRGWYVLKDDGTSTDMDYYVRTSYAETNPAMTQYENILANSGVGTAIQGKAVSLAFFPAYKCNETTIEENGDEKISLFSGSAWVIQTEQKMVSLPKALSRFLYSDFADHFYESPTVVNPQGVFGITVMDPYGMWILNDGHLYSICTIANNIGKFSPKTITGVKEQLFPEIVWSDRYVFTYDQTTNRFYYASVLAGNLVAVDDTLYAPNDENIFVRDLAPVKLFHTTVSPYSTSLHGLALLKHKTQANTFYIAKIESSASGNPFTFIKPFPADADLLNPDVKVAAATAIANAVYYVKNDNELWIYTDSDEPIATRQRLELTYPAEETIVNIQPIQQSTRTISWVCVTTNTADGHYRVYIYNTQGATAELQTPEAFLMSGNGYAKMVYPRFY
jgi:hypothetical protein